MGIRLLLSHMPIIVRSIGELFFSLREILTCLDWVSGIQLVDASNKIVRVIQNITQCYIPENKEDELVGYGSLGGDSVFQAGLHVDPNSKSLVMNGKPGHLQCYSLREDKHLYTVSLLLRYSFHSRVASDLCRVSARWTLPNRILWLRKGGDQFQMRTWLTLHFHPTGDGWLPSSLWLKDSNTSNFDSSFGSLMSRNKCRCRKVLVTSYRRTFKSVYFMCSLFEINEYPLDGI